MKLDTLVQGAIIFLAISAMTWAWMDSSRQELEAARYHHDINQRGFIGCKDGHYVIENIDFGPGAQQLLVPADNPCVN